MKLLLKRDVSVQLEYRDINNRTALSWARERGDEAIVKQLLRKRASLESKDKCG